jgi:hypothetical protein
LAATLATGSVDGFDFLDFPINLHLNSLSILSGYPQGCFAPALALLTLLTLLTLLSLLPLLSLPLLLSLLLLLLSLFLSLLPLLCFLTGQFAPALLQQV